MRPMWRDLYTWVPAQTAPEAVETLLARRDGLYRPWLELTIVLQVSHFTLPLAHVVSTGVKGITFGLIAPVVSSTDCLLGWF